MSSHTLDALRVLEHNDMKMERLLLDFIAQPNTIRMFNDEYGEEWAFTARRRCRLFLMAKHKQMKKYEAIYSTSK
jgi:hypothetical protein